MGMFRYFLLSLFFSFCSFLCFSQLKVSGYVFGAEDQLPLYPVSVIIKGTPNGTVTDFAGYFKITANIGSTLVFSFIGYESQEVTIGNESVLHISLITSASGMSEAVMTGYTSQKVKEITGSVSIVKGNDLTEVPTGQVESMLQGKVSGLTVINSGMPGASSTVRINGIGNFGNTTPLYIIDGVEADINNLNPDDIESLQVLKDAGAYAIYGVRGSNGVIIVTTKTGRNGKTRIRYDSYFERTIPLSHGIELLNPQESGTARWQGYRNSGQVDPSTGNPSDPVYGSGPDPIIPDFRQAGPYTGLFAEIPGQATRHTTLTIRMVIYTRSWLRIKRVQIGFMNYSSPLTPRIIPCPFPEGMKKTNIYFLLAISISRVHC